VVGARGAKAGPRKASAARSPRLEALTEELRAVAEEVGIRVRQERLLREVGYHTQSGLVRMGNEEILLLDQDLSPEARVDLLVGVLADRDLSRIALSDDVRRALALPESPDGPAPPTVANAADDAAPSAARQGGEASDAS
jgi:hypothetical protein